jgi:four helix bundle protein
MATIFCFEDIEAWQNARKLSRRINACTRKTAFSADSDLRRQMRRAAVSAMSNIAEGFERDGAGEFTQFLSIAKGSVGEVESHLYVAWDEEYITKVEFDEIRSLAVFTKRLIAGFMRYLKRSGHRGQKFKK